ncbi:MAG: hypothetical protein M1812_001561 [Candelaria pacifica]|nr:MAG: hypothetical protein M1812_001561 [Candelaria pacifica]
MFRNPRENVMPTIQTPSRPSTGRPPTPPFSDSGIPYHVSYQASTSPAAMGSTTPLTAKSNTALNGSAGRGKKSPAANNVSNGRAKGKAMANGSILNFFKKADPSLFIGHEAQTRQYEVTGARSASPEDGLLGTVGDVDGFGDVTRNGDQERYNESQGAIKRRKLHSPTASQNDDAKPLGEASRITEPESNGEARRHIASNDDATTGEPKTEHDACSPPPPDINDQTVTPGPIRNRSESCQSDEISDRNVSAPVKGEDQKVRRKVGPFVEDSDSEMEEDYITTPFIELKQKTVVATTPPTNCDQPLNIANESGLVQANMIIEERNDLKPSIPRLKEESTSLSEANQFDDIEDFGDDEYMDGEEFEGRRWMEEEERRELAEEGLENGSLGQPDGIVKQEVDRDAMNLETPNDTLATCPICDASLAGISDSEATVHVNHCLDGNPTPLPEQKPLIKPDPTTAIEKPALHSSRFQRTPRPPKPGQENPFELGSSKPASGSAFSKLMSTHAEDAAWANAAAAENASRGKPAYQRTCPFYKILPGLFICVDAFRYGAVEGCQAYFLSHFHSDHYIGLTATWQHGPIYCSRVTANLVRQQLRVDPKWVVDLEFEQKVEVSGTNGVEVTMIPANHCPGSSLFLFEKVTGKGKTPKVQRILHCGDFRACPAHLQHPLLRPEVVDAVNGKQLGQQKIDVCYLDTTYLNPKYAFPCQEDVIKACADMCVSLRKERADETDGWEQMKRERAGSGMVKFARTNSNAIKEEADDEASGIVEDDDGMKVDGLKNGKARGRLLVVVGTYSIGKERICMGIARALNSKIYAPPNKQRICACLEDAELNSRLTRNPQEAQVHMTPLMEIRAETLHEYLTTFKPHFSRVVGFRPSGWNYRPPNSRFVESPAIKTVLFSENWKSRYSMADLMPQRGSTREASCFGVPYSEHSSFRELSMFCCALRIEKIVPTVNIGSAKSREKMKAWCEKWAAERKKNGLFRLGKDGAVW